MILREAIGVGSTVEAAMEDAMNQLNPGLEDNVMTETLSLPKKKMLGIFGGREAKVRAYIEVPDEVKKVQKEKNKKKPNNDKKSVQKSAEINKKQETLKAEAKKTVAKDTVGVPASEIDPASPAGRAYAYLVTILKQFDCSDISAVISEVEGGSKITLEGSDKLGVIIGRRGETLDALQYLASLVANERGGGYYRIVIDIGNYREKREGTLEALAKKTANQVLRTGRSRSLEPMNPYERRVIHTTVQNIEGVSSMSIGDGSSRRVVISPEGKSPRQGGGRDNRRGGNGSRGGQRNQRSEVKNTEAAENSKPKETDGTKLYGRLG